MKRLLRIAGWTGATLIVASLLGALAIVAVLGQMHPDLTLHVGHDPVVMGDLDAGHALLALGGIALALFVVLTVVPLSLAFATVIVAGTLALVLAIVLALATWMASPILLLGGLAWWLLRHRRTAAGMRPEGAAQA
jgi:hypothetical protein